MPHIESLDAPTPVARTRTERLLHFIGADPVFTDAIIGDLAEERALRAPERGRIAAHVWYLREVLRSAPHLVRNALQRGSPGARVRLIAIIASPILAIAAATAATLLRDGPPASLDIALKHIDDGIVVNSLLPTQLPMRVLDARGHQLESSGLRFSQTSGMPVELSADGVVRCAHRGDTKVRASIGTVTRDLDVRCRPVRMLDATTWIDFIAGDGPRRIPFKAVGFDGAPVMQLRGSMSVLDDRVAMIEGTNVRPLAIGATVVIVQVAEHRALMRVVVHESVRSFVGLGADQRYVAMHVSVAQGDTVRWALPKGVYWLKYMPRDASEAPPTIQVEGPINCSSGDGLHVYRMPLEEYGKYCMAVRDGASVTIAHGRVGAAVARGSLALERADMR